MIKSEQIKRGKLGGKGLGGGNSDFGAGMGVDGSGGFAGNHGAHYVADRQSLGAFGFGLTLRSDGVRGLTRLGDQHGDCVRSDDGVAIPPLAGVIHFDWNSRQALDHELASLGGVPTGSAGGNVDFLRPP